jgi:putative ABC transport system permease protein
VQSRGATWTTAHGDEIAVRVAAVSGDFFPLFRQTAASGTLLSAEGVASSGPVAVVSHKFWQRYLESDPGALGKLLVLEPDWSGRMRRMGAAEYRIVGVSADDFAYPAGSTTPIDVFVPLVVTPEERTGSRRTRVSVLARLPDGATGDGAQAALDVLAANLAQDDPDGPGLWVQSYRDAVVGRVDQLDAAPAVGRRPGLPHHVRERRQPAAGARERPASGSCGADGARRATMADARQLVLEGLLLALAGTAFGIVIGRWGLELLLTSLPPGIPRATEIALDWRLLGIAGLAAVVTGILFGLTPAAFSTRVDVSSALKGGRTGSAGGSGLRIRSLLIVGEMALALILLMAALLFGASFLRVTSVPLGIDYRNVAMVSVENRFERSAGEDIFAPNNRFHDLVGRIVERVAAEPGVQAIAATSGVAFSVGKASFSYELPGRPDFTWQRDRDPMLTMKLVSPNYHDLLRIPLRRGRLLQQTDVREAPGVVVVSESAARQIWPGEDPIGQRIDLQKVLTVVGVVADVRMGGPEADPWPDVYVPVAQGVGTVAGTLLIRTALPTEQMLPAVRAAIQDVDPAQRAADVRTMESYLDRMLAPRRFNMLVVGAFGVLGVLIAAIGLYGVMAYVVTQRTHEIGIRMALGATRLRVIGMVLSRAALLALAGLVIGAAGVWYFARLVQSFLFELEPLDARVASAAVAVMALAAFLAAAIPARRAASVDPLVALRQD